MNSDPVTVDVDGTELPYDLWNPVASYAWSVLNESVTIDEALHTFRRTSDLIFRDAMNSMEGWGGPVTDSDLLRLDELLQRPAPRSNGEEESW